MSPKFSTRVAGKLYYTNQEGRGVFSERRDGTDVQHVGLLDAPWFTSAKQLGSWIRRNLEVQP